MQTIPMQFRMLLATPGRHGQRHSPGVGVTMLLRALDAEVDAESMAALTAISLWLFTCLVRLPDPRWLVGSLGPSGPVLLICIPALAMYCAALLILAATMVEGVVFTATSTAISLVLRAPMCQGRLSHIDTNQGMHSLCQVQTTTSAAGEGEDSMGIILSLLSRTDRRSVLKSRLKGRCH